MLGYLCFMITMTNAMRIASPRSWPASSKALPLERACFTPKDVLNMIALFRPSGPGKTHVSIISNLEHRPTVNIILTPMSWAEGHVDVRTPTLDGMPHLEDKLSQYPPFHATRGHFSLQCQIDTIACYSRSTIIRVSPRGGAWFSPSTPSPLKRRSVGVSVKGASGLPKLLIEVRNFRSPKTQ